MHLLPKIACIHVNEAERRRRRNVAVWFRVIVSAISSSKSLCELESACVCADGGATLMRPCLHMHVCMRVRHTCFCMHVRQRTCHIFPIYTALVASHTTVETHTGVRRAATTTAHAGSGGNGSEFVIVARSADDTT